MQFSFIDVIPKYLNFATFLKHLLALFSRIFSVLLQNVSPVDGALEGQVRLDEDGENVVLDALHVLNSKQICLSALQQECEDDPAADNVDKVTSILVKARNKAIGEVSTNLNSHVCYLFLYLNSFMYSQQMTLMSYSPYFLDRFLAIWKSHSCNLLFLQYMTDTVLQ
jgi:hypothetical protein